MLKPVVTGRPVRSKILLVGQAPGVHEPELRRPFAWTAGKTLFKWLELAVGWDEEVVRSRVYFAAVCRCFPGKNPAGGDRVPSSAEIEACSHWLAREFAILRPQLVIPVGRLAISQFLSCDSLASVVGRKWTATVPSGRCDIIPLPHPSGASTWHHVEPGRTLLRQALGLLAKHPCFKGASTASSQHAVRPLQKRSG